MTYDDSDMLLLESASNGLSSSYQGQGPGSIVNSGPTKFCDQHFIFT